MGHTLGLALGGGGGKGSAHIGVLRVLERLEVPIDMVAGTSIGSIVGALVAAGYKAAEIEVAFRSAKLHRILELDFANFGLLGTTKLAAMLREMLGDRHIEDLHIPYAAVTVDLVSGREVHLTAGPVVEAALASAAVPGIFPPVRINEAVLIDGGLFNNVPVDVTRHLGAERVIAVDLIGAARDFAIHEAQRFSLRGLLPLSQIQLVERAVELGVQRLTAARLRETQPDLLLSPDVGAISMFEVTRISDGIASGEKEALRYADEIAALRDWRGPHP